MTQVQRIEMATLCQCHQKNIKRWKCFILWLWKRKYFDIDNEKESLITKKNRALVGRWDIILYYSLNCLFFTAWKTFHCNYCVPYFPTEQKIHTQHLLEIIKKIDPSSISISFTTDFQKAIIKTCCNVFPTSNQIFFFTFFIVYLSEK